MPQATRQLQSLHSALVRNTGFLISRMGLVASKHFGERIGTLGLTTRMWGALNVLDAEGPITQGALCAAVHMDPSSMVSTIDELESHGMVERRRHPTDRRAYALHVTDHGHDVLARGRALAREAQEELLAPLNEEERVQLRELLLKLAAASDELTSPPG
jgi:DNA-binding MarR family transcriptional regulator